MLSSADELQQPGSLHPAVVASCSFSEVDMHVLRLDLLVCNCAQHPACCNSSKPPFLLAVFATEVKF